MISLGDLIRPVVYAVARDGYQIVTLIDQTATGRLATARLALSGGGPEDAALDLIAERGYHRGKDLQAEYRSLLDRLLPGH